MSGTHPVCGLLAPLERDVLFPDVFGQLVFGAAQEDALAAREAVRGLVDGHVLLQRLLAGEMLLAHAAGGPQLDPQLSAVAAGVRHQRTGCLWPRRLGGHVRWRRPAARGLGRSARLRRFS